MMTTDIPVHPLGSKTKILLSSVFGPYARDDRYGSRQINPMELYQNQVTRFQGAFSLRMFHRSFGLMLLQANIDAPCSLLDFPSLERFTDEISRQSYDVVGISAIMVNTEKVKKMCELVRKHLPRAVIVIGGHIANQPDLSQKISADHIVKGDGVRWFRKFLSQDPDAPVRHPLALAGFGTRSLGITFKDRPGSTAAILIPSVGCPLGCNFCSTSAMFGGKGKFINFYETGDELFSVMCRIEARLKVRSFFVMDENFLFHRKRALRLLELMQQHGKSWSLYVFSSARVLQSYSIEQLVGLGISWVWMGLEGEKSRYAKLSGIDSRQLVKNLQSHGIRVLGSSIIGMEQHTAENIDQAIDYAVSHDTVFHQFMLYTPVAGTPLYEEHRQAGTLFPESEFALADAHGQYRFNYRHPHIRNGREEEFLQRAFQRDFEINGPSLARLIDITLTGWQRYKNHPDQRIRARFRAEGSLLSTAYSAAAWAIAHCYRGDDAIGPRLDALLKRVYREFGWQTRLVAALVGRFLYWKLKQEERRLSRGWSYEPKSFYEKNDAALALEKKSPALSQQATVGARSVTAKLSPISG